jgi:hypothetical protein
MSLQRPAVEFHGWAEKGNDQHKEKLKTTTFVGENVLPEVERRKNPFGDLISELEWENQPCRIIRIRIIKSIEPSLNNLEVRDNVAKRYQSQRRKKCVEPTKLAVFNCGPNLSKR